ncbi:putative oxidoreductase [Pelomonas saccharophila]|uniref:Oxidoreductase n=1 Tax=Roseateles saccharophilus TaxID=304 RepID=A0ABU1YWF0_ROSSA|nr:DoxX family protein [Roseateles saccharophilus]MDR7273211.1 putative oxidoreductase [Roseateles saccharophilus]
MTRWQLVIKHVIGSKPVLPLSLVTLVARAAIVTVFASSASAHLADWNTTLFLFEDEYHLPLLPPAVAALLGVGVELVGSALLAIGLWTRLAAFALLMVVTVIQLLVYPAAWPEHLQWATPLVLVVSLGGGRISLDALLERRLATIWSARPNP